MNFFLFYYTVYINLFIHFYLGSSYGCSENKSSEDSAYQFISPEISSPSFNRLNVQLRGFDRNFTLELESNIFLSDNYREQLYPNDVNDRDKSLLQESNLCHYKGSVVGVSQSWAAVSYCHNQLNGIFEADNVVYHLQQSPNNQQVKIFVNPNSFTNRSCGFDNFSVARGIALRKRRNTYNSNYNPNRRRYVELVVVNDFKVFKKYGKNSEFIFNRSKQIINIVNALYSQLNITVALVGVMVWSEKDEISITTDSSETLNNFLKYRRDVLTEHIPNDNAQLITGIPFENGIVGKALKQTICTYEYSGGVNYDYSESISLVATTVAHELGHNFGMEHDTNDCLCQSKSCIMGPSSSYPSPRHWSSCSISQIDESFKHGMDHCLLNKPQILFRPSCGNGFVDKGEECDCGMVDVCNNPCCNSTTCKLTTNAECAHGECCDKQTCKIKVLDEGHVCRAAKSVCDIPEKCDGKSEFCPKDQVVKDGTECQEGYAYCFAGLCNSRENQCKLLWGKTGEVADYRCFQHNIYANSSGNCGYDKKTKKYIHCDNVKDIICGRLHCTHRTEKLDYGPEAAATISKSRIDFRTGRIYCYSAIIDLGLQEPDPGLVPNGAKCGTNSMCVDHKCVPVMKYITNKPCPFNCNKNGYCDNEGKCHCFNNFDSFDCSSYASGNVLTIFIYVLFFGVFPLLALSALLFYNNQGRIKSWFYQQSIVSQDYNNKRQKKHPSRLIISDPIPNQINSADVFLKPTRPAPPPPIKVTNHALCETEEPSASRPFQRQSISRPKKPPPKPPKPETQSNEDSRVKTLVYAI